MEISLPRRLRTRRRRDCDQYPLAVRCPPSSAWQDESDDQWEIGKLILAWACGHAEDRYDANELCQRVVRLHLDKNQQLHVVLKRELSLPQEHCLRSAAWHVYGLLPIFHVAPSLRWERVWAARRFDDLGDSYRRGQGR